ncbi:MAG: hypothetical protein WHS88_05700 [Anaerohalosphaeraceae bacterium]
MNRTGLLATAALPVLLLLNGCFQTFNEEKVVFPKYDGTILRQSTSAQVLSSIYEPLTEYLSQSESVVASWNERDKGRTHWFNMVAFDEDSLLAVRKYGFSCVEQRLGPNAPPRPKVRLDAELVLDERVLNTAYPNQNARLIAVLKEAQKQFNADALQVTGDSQTLQSSAMMVNQLLQTVLIKLEQTPAMAARLSWLEGLEFDHPTLGQSRIRMLILNDIVKIKIKASPAWFRHNPFEKHPDVMYM